VPTTIRHYGAHGAGLLPNEIRQTWEGMHGAQRRVVIDVGTTA
jgi:hypothetical protein